MNALLDAVRQFADAHARREIDGVVDGPVATPVPGLLTVRATAPSALDHALMRPMVCLVLQGAKHVVMGARSFDFSAGDTLLIAADLPVASRITNASAAAPYYSLVVELDAALIADLVVEMGAVPVPDATPFGVEPTDAQVADAALRLLRLLERPASVPVLQGSLLRELHYWLLAGRHGAAIRQLGWPQGSAQRVARAVAVLRAEFARPLPVERLADVAGMSPSAFHAHFRKVTSLSPLQFQKQLRLIEARRLMLAEGATASRAAFAVGYESVPQFTREYGRLFGQPPARETGAARRQAQATA